MVKYFWREKFLKLLEETQNFQKVQEIYDSEITENNSLDDFINFNNDFWWVLTKEMIEMIDFLEPFKWNYYIAWWTAISLHLKHRESVDFDTFSNWNNIDLNFLHNHILNYSNNKFKIFWKVSKWFETWWEKDKIYNDEKWEKFWEKRYDLITKNNIADLINNNQEVHLKINWVTVDVSDYSRRLNPSEWSFISVWHFIEWFPLKVPSLLDLWWMKIWAISSRIKNKDFEDIRYILKEGYTLEELLNSYIWNFWNNLIFYWYFSLFLKQVLSIMKNMKE